MGMNGSGRGLLTAEELQGHVERLAQQNKFLKTELEEAEDREALKQKEIKKSKLRIRELETEVQELQEDLEVAEEKGAEADAKLDAAEERAEDAEAQAQAAEAQAQAAGGGDIQRAVSSEFTSGELEDMLQEEREALAAEREACAEERRARELAEAQLTVLAHKLTASQQKISDLQSAESDLKSFMDTLEKAAPGGARGSRSRSTGRSRSRPKSRPHARPDELGSPPKNRRSTTPGPRPSTPGKERPGARTLRPVPKGMERFQDRASETSNSVGVGKYDVYHQGTIGASKAANPKKYVPPKNIKADRGDWIKAQSGCSGTGADRMYDNTGLDWTDGGKNAKNSAAGVMRSKVQRFGGSIYQKDKTPGVGKYDIYERDTIASKAERWKGEAVRRHAADNAAVQGWG